MIQRDYFLRQLEQLGKVLGKILANILGLKSGGGAGITISTIEESLQNELEIDIDKMISLPEEAFLETLTQKMKFNDVSLEKLADIFYEMIILYPDTKKQKLLSEKALTLYKYLEAQSGTFSFDRNQKINALEKKQAFTI